MASYALFNLGLNTGWTLGEDGWEAGVDYNWLVIDTLLQGRVMSVGLNTPPAAPNDGECYIVGTAPTGVWGGFANGIAIRDSGTWTVIMPLKGWKIYDRTTEQDYRYGGTAWNALDSFSDVNLLVNGHLRFDNYHDPAETVYGLPLQRDVIADAVLYGWGGDPYEVNTQTQSLLNVGPTDRPLQSVGRAVKFAVQAAGDINAVGDSEYHHHFRLICPPERVREVGDNGGCFFKFWVRSNHNATYSVSALNWTRSRAFVRQFEVVNDDEWHQVLLWFPLDNNELSNPGWLTQPGSDGNGFGISFRVLLGARNDCPYLATAPDQWESGNIVGVLGSDFGAVGSNEISFADFRLGLTSGVQAKDFQSDKAEVETYCYGHSSNKNSRTALCQINTGWIAEFNFNPAIEFRKTPGRIFVLGAYTDGSSGDYRVQNAMGSTLRVDVSKFVLSSLPIGRNPLLRFSYASGGYGLSPSYQAMLRLPVASYIAGGVDLSGAGVFSLRVFPSLDTVTHLNGNYATQADFLNAVSSVPGVASATVDGADLVIVCDARGEYSCVYLDAFIVPDGGGGTIDLLDLTKVYVWPPMRGLQAEFNLNIQMIRSAIMGEAAGRKPLFYWDAVP